MAIFVMAGGIGLVVAIGPQNMPKGLVAAIVNLLAIDLAL